MGLLSLARIGKKGWAQESPENENLVEIAISRWFFCPTMVTKYTDPDQINPVSIDNWPIVACQIWPR